MTDRKKQLIPIILAAVIWLCNCSSGEEFLKPSDLKVLDRPANSMMTDYLTGIVDKQFAERATLLSGLKTTGDWNRHVELIKKSMAEWTGPLPRRTPLRARITGRINREKYTLEKILFESRPNFLVSANLYLPKGYSSPCPAVLNVIGHSPAGKATEKVQRRAIAQARKGFVALVIDGIGQGERQVKDYSRFGKPPGNAHQIVGTQAFIAGTHVFNFMVWDTIRAVDYLVSRPEVDPKRIACTGCSGGGMMTTYVLAFEPRISVAVPTCNPCTWSHRVHANLATDHEQVFFGAFAAGIDPRGDPLFCHVPKPLLINATTDDTLNPTAGVWELSTWLYKAYSAHSAPHKFQTTMVKAPHDYNKEQREVAYSWMLQWAEGDASDFQEEDFAVEKEQDTWCTAAGNVYQQPDSREPHDLVLAYLESHRPTKSLTKQELQAAIKDVLRIKESVDKPQIEIGTRLNLPSLSNGQSAFDGPILRSVIIKPEDGIVLPAVRIEPVKRNSGGPVVIYLNDKGKSSLAEEQDILKTLLERGCVIFAVDLRGSGETAPSQEGKFWDFLAGRPIFSQRVGDVRSIIRYLSHSETGDKEIYIWAKGMSAVYAVLALTLEEKVTGIVLEGPLLSFEQVVTTKVPAYRHEVILPGVLQKFDLPQIYQALCPMKVTLINPLAGDKSAASQERVDQEYKQIAKKYANDGKTDWYVHTNVDEKARINVILSACQ